MKQPSNSTAVVKASPIAETLPDVKLTETILHEALASWSPADTRDGVSTANTVVSHFASAAQSLMDAGIAVYEFEQRHSEAMAQELAKAISKLGIRGLSESNLWTLRQRAVVFVKTFPNGGVRRHLLLATKGEGVIVRQETGENKGTYLLSPYYQQAMEKVGKQPTTDGDAAERYARLVAAIARKQRGNERSNPTVSAKAERALKQWAAFVAFAVSENKDGSRKHPGSERVIARTLGKMAELAISESTDVSEFAGVADIISDACEEETSKQQAPNKKTA